MACMKDTSHLRFSLFVIIFNSCGTTFEHCGNLDPTVGQGNCQQTGCAPGLCCSRFGYCGRTAEHCAGTPGFPVPGGCPTCNNNALPSCGTTGCAGKK
ncbi:unnamed protein product [Rotaria magnacalcarata]|uniref:Chitin-binding type-1 domain-containing protein n=1 Tax=Rotaria magnacalcarata TaxID=392030 RepID=A0A8S3JYL7_9BILA|nr:unnamed protein product [Rotaria magnacalcarata]CAF5222560.1 unnamed protein product [Rotaria magnacalcarata]